MSDVLEVIDLDGDTIIIKELRTEEIHSSNKFLTQVTIMYRDVEAKGYSQISTIKYNPHIEKNNAINCALTNYDRKANML